MLKDLLTELNSLHKQLEGIKETHKRQEIYSRIDCVTEKLKEEIKNQLLQTSRTPEDLLNTILWYLHNINGLEERVVWKVYKVFVEVASFYETVRCKAKFEELVRELRSNL